MVACDVILFAAQPPSSIFSRIVREKRFQDKGQGLDQETPERSHKPCSMTVAASVYLPQFNPLYYCSVTTGEVSEGRLK